jgi:hypothetical protein
LSGAREWSDSHGGGVFSRRLLCIVATASRREGWGLLRQNCRHLPW